MKVKFSLHMNLPITRVNTNNSQPNSQPDRQPFSQPAPVKWYTQAGINFRNQLQPIARQRATSFEIFRYSWTWWWWCFSLSRIVLLRVPLMVWWAMESGENFYYLIIFNLQCCFGILRSFKKFSCSLSCFMFDMQFKQGTSAYASRVGGGSIFIGQITIISAFSMIASTQTISCISYFSIEITRNQTVLSIRIAIENANDFPSKLSSFTLPKRNCNSITNRILSEIFS